jgi:hypothetical protein
MHQFGRCGYPREMDAETVAEAALAVAIVMSGLLCVLVFSRSRADTGPPVTATLRLSLGLLVLSLLAAILFEILLGVRS